MFYVVSAGFVPNLKSDMARPTDIHQQLLRVILLYTAHKVLCSTQPSRNRTHLFSCIPIPCAVPSKQVATS